MADPDFARLFAPDIKSEGPDFTSLFAPDEEEPKGMTWGEAFQSAKKVAPSNALEVARGVANTLSPYGIARKVYGYATNPQSAADEVGGIIDRYKGLFTEDGLKQEIATNPVGLGLEVASIATPFKALKGRAAPKPKTIVREGAELRETGGKRIQESKLSEETMPWEDTVQPFNKLTAKLESDAVDMSSASPRAQNLYKRLRALHTQAPNSPMSPITGVMSPLPKPVSMKELHALKNEAKRVIESGKNPDGTMGTDGFIGMQLKATIDEMIGIHPEGGTFKVGSHEYHRGKQDQVLEDALNEAKRSRAWLNGNEVEAIGNQIRPLLRRKSKHYHTFTPKQRQRLETLLKKGESSLVTGFASKTFSGNVFARGIEMGMGLYPGTFYLPAKAIRETRIKKFHDEFDKFREDIRSGSIE